MKMFLVMLAAFCLAWLPGGFVCAAELVLVERLHHLRIDGPREWSEFAETPSADHLEVKFDARPNESPQTLRIRQQDVKQTWRVLLNGKQLGRLRVDENDTVIYFAVPPATLVDGENVLRIEQEARRQTPDDVRVGEIVLDSRTMNEVLAEATVEVEVRDAKTGQTIPSRLTVLNDDGALQTPAAESNDHLAVRPGIVYTSTGRAKFGLPAGDYTIYAGRGFEYSLAEQTIRVAAGQSERIALAIRREVPMPGYVACDTHVHTLTHSGHGDATVEERMITLAAEGIELPIATDHNVQIDHNPFARRMRVRQYFTPVVGNEVTTRTGHFNIFPVAAGAKIPDYKSDDWQITLDGIFQTPGVKVAILNHARDVHSGTRPFGPKLFNAVVGENLAGWPLRFNAMEVINSAATQNDVMRLFRDWMGLLNRGRRVTPVGSSDSHYVGRHFVGQGRTYIRCDDGDVGNLDIDQAVNSFLTGRVMVSCGLLAEITVNGKYSCGELATTPGENVHVDLRVLGPHWVTADRITLYVNGRPIREEQIRNVVGDRLPTGVLWADRWTLPKPRHDVHLVAIASGPGIDGLYWKTAKPHQPGSPDWQPRVIGCSGAVWLDVDGDGRRTAAYDYARRMVDKTDGDQSQLIQQLASFDEAVAAQAAHALQTGGTSLLSDEFQRLLLSAAPPTKAGVRNYLTAWRENQMSQSER